MDPSSSNKPMEKPINLDPQPLKCPRCDSSNTKFCYYNNYSLSQPRHFCKACKRYWTRGGTLRSVPVGGGCRKNKRVKRPQPANGAGVGVSTAVASHVQPPQIASNQMSNSLYYNTQPTNNLELNFPFSTFSSSGVLSGFNFHQPHINMNGFALGFSSGLLTREAQSQGRIQDFIDQQDPVIMGSAGSFGSTSRMATLLANGQDMEVRGGNGTSNGREVKVEGENRSNEFQNNQLHDDQHLNRSSDANSSILWNTSNIGSWFDPSNNLGFLSPSLI